MGKCSHKQGFQLVEVENRLSQDMEKADSSTVNLTFNIMGRARCLGCGAILREPFSWHMNVEFGLKVHPQFQSDDFDDGEDPEDSYV